MSQYVIRRNNYFMLENGSSWTPIGFNESITWDLLSNNPRDYLIKLKAKGINCLRLFFEYSEKTNSYLENPLGVFNGELVEKWKELFSLAQEFDIRFIMSPYDTFWQWEKWDKHPYNKNNGGYLSSKEKMITDPKTIDIHKNRFKFLIETFSSSGTIFAWDIWNEVNPAYAEGNVKAISDYITTISAFIKETEMSLYGKKHLQTCSMFAPDLNKHKDPELNEIAFRHPSLDFCSIHLYDEQTVSYPKNTVEPAAKVAGYVRDVLGQIKDGRPFIDTENGPIDYFSKLGQLEEEFDNEYFKNMAWAHLASGGAGPGMRWPYRHPHTLTDDMLDTLDSIQEFSKIINWNTFSRQNISNQIINSNGKQALIFGCGTGDRFIVNVLRRDALTSKGVFDSTNKKLKPVDLKISIPGVLAGNYKIWSWKEDTKTNSLVTQNSEKSANTSMLTFMLRLKRSLVLYVERM